MAKATKKEPAKKAAVKKAAVKKAVAKKEPTKKAVAKKEPTKKAVTKEPASATRVKKPTRAAAKKKAPASVETSQSIEEQTKAFLAKGGKVDAINIGVSGQQNLAGPKHITLGNKSNKG